jgi:hypothetical protein
MQKNDNISQVLLSQFDGVFTENITIIDDSRAGFSFKSSMFRRDNYLLVEGGFARFTRNVSYGKDGNLAEKILSLHYYEQGLKVYAPNVTMAYDL